ncbi:unnamed protein product, partial [Rotaria sp. Silwood2]
MVYFRPGSRYCIKHEAEGKMSLDAAQFAKRMYGTTANVSINTLTSMLDDIWTDWKRCNTVLE